MDERLKMHRYYSSRIALLVFVIITAALFYYDFFKNDLIRWDLFVILSVTAFSKIAAMVYYRRTN